jgi:putative FmdB family regulatory protein
VPTYEFQCKACVQTLTITATMSELRTPKCQDCNTWMHRIFTIQGVNFKGSGFYTTDKSEDK